VRGKDHRREDGKEQACLQQMNVPLRGAATPYQSRTPIRPRSNAPLGLRGDSGRRAAFG
jgi:hypothetical protein